VTEEEFAQILARGYEVQGVEFKGPGPRTNKRLFAKVARAVLGMANRRYGGLVIIGVADKAGDPDGLRPEDLRTWKYDDIAVALSDYADPNVNFDLETVSYQGRSYVVLRIREFSDLPILCCKEFAPDDGPLVCRRGACYVRSSRKPETSEVPSQEDMRELLDLAIDKGVRRFISRSNYVGLGGFLSAPTPPDSHRFAEQLEATAETKLREKIQSRGYWEVVIRPEKFEEKRIEYPALFSLVQRSSVELRGWDYPHIDHKSSPLLDLNWVGQDTDWNHYLETWRMYQSGQLLHTSGMIEDWFDQSSIFSIEPGWEPGRILYAINTLFKYTEIFEFAARMALAIEGDDPLQVQITLHGLRGRRLTEEGVRLVLSIYNFVSSMDSFPYQVDKSRTELIARPRELALDAAQQLFQRFGWNVSLEFLREEQFRLRSTS